MTIVKYEIINPVTDKKKPHFDNRGFFIIPNAKRPYKYYIEARRYETFLDKDATTANCKLYAYKYYILLGTDKFDSQCRKCRVDDYNRLIIKLHGEIENYAKVEIKARGNVDVEYLNTEVCEDSGLSYDVWEIR